MPSVTQHPDPARGPLALGLGFALIAAVAVTAPAHWPAHAPPGELDCAAALAPRAIGEAGEAGEAPEGREPDVQEDALHGLWMRYEGRGEGDPLRFWYFHGDGKGLYRYGKVGLANTHSFDYEMEVSNLFLRVRKTGAEHQIEVELGRDEHGRSWLQFHDDPYEPGARYYRVESDLGAADSFAPLLAGPAAVVAASPTASPTPAGAAQLGDRIWIDFQRFATGGAEFHMYQLADTAIDGRGVGWFHRGDFDDWSTESLTYRIDGDQLELFFDLREEPNVTRFELVDGPHGRELVLAADPRDYWATHRYQDGGKSF